FAHIHFENCTIGSLNLLTAHSVHTQNTIILRECHIGKLKIEKDSCKFLKIFRSSIALIDCTTTAEENPFSGGIEIDDESTLYAPNVVPYELNTQGLRNLRFHIGTMLNHQAAQIVFAYEKKCELDTTNPYSDISSFLSKNSLRNSFVFIRRMRSISFWYNLTSFYGNSIIRPMLWIGLAITLLLIAIAVTDATLQPVACEMGASGWISSLCECRNTNIFLRNLIASIESTINPMATLVGKSFVPSKYIWISFLQSLQGLFSITMIALTIIAIRRKFKFQ
ncbi:hypothetical protein KAR91_14110, partial [Candidatus Pacearchaeota archaeon]|nr:hypothetical protein [Candidatus Pacearchaeota archaeon]